MKKIYIYISVFALAVLALGCSKEVDVQDDELQSEAVNDGLEETITVMLSVPETPETKTTLGAKDGSSYPVYWSAGDVITLNGTAASEFTPASGNASATAKFKVTGLTTPYNFLYLGVAGQSNQVTFPANQAYVANGFDPAAMPMYASLAARTDNVTFSHVASLLRFSITGEKKIDSVTLTAADANTSLSGTFTIGATGGVLNGSLTPASGGGAINYNFGGHIQLSETPFVFYVAVPAGTYAGGINLEIVDNDSGHMNVAVLDGNSNTLAAGKVVEFDNITYIPAKANNLKQIWNTTTFQEFVTAVAGGNKTLNARLTPSAASIDLSSVAGSFASIEGYKGTFDGNGKTLSGLTKPMFDDLQGVVKNLTLNSTIAATAADGYHWGIFANQIIPSLEVDDVPGLQNCTANGSITWTPASAVNSMMTLGGLVGNNKGGTITGCTNNAAVTFANNGVSNGNQPSIGGVVGRTQKGGDLKTQGEISNCNNYGTVICAAEFSQNIYIGGVLGYQVEKAETMSGCVNHGLVKVASTASTGGALQLGGVIGMGKGTIESCTNASDGVVTSEAGFTSSSYINQGGVVGRLNRESDSYSGLSNAGTINVGAITTSTSTGVYVGGVVGRCNEGASLSDLTNSGSINASLEEPGYTTFIGGIVSRITKSLSNCNSTGGTINYTGTSAASALYIGGVVGYTNTASVAITSCTSAMTINVGGAFSPTGGNFYATGGIIGNVANASASVSDCLNTGNITVSQDLTSNGYTYLGGVAGRTQGSISNSSNGGTVTFSGRNSAQNPWIGGIVGDTPDDIDISISGKYSSASATNYGNVVVNTSIQSNKYLYVGGVVGRLRCAVSSATNAGQINVPQLTCTSLYAGGIAGSGTTGNASITSCQNLADGDVNISGLTSNQSSYIGGIAGHAENSSITFTDCTNYGDIVVTSGSKVARDYTIGGIAGTINCALSSCTNSGLVSNAAPMTGGTSYWLQMGGIVGWNNTSATITGCHNTGNVTNTGNSGGYITIGGVSSENKALISNSDNTGNVTNSGNSGNGRPIAIGGVVGYAHEAGLTSCSNGTSSAVGGTVSNSGTSATVFNNDSKDPGIAIGGVAGINNGYTITTCYNKGEVSNAGASPSSYIVVGGLVGLSKGGSSYAAPCYNTGAISNTGLVGAKDLETPDNDKWVDVGGLIGLAFEANTLSGTSSVYNYNSGTVTENSESIKPYVGGICGESDYAASDFTYCSNRSGGNLTVKNNTRRNITIGGVVGADWQSSTMTNTSNSGNIYVQDITGSNCINVGGVLGLTGTATLISGADASHRTTNSGNIQFKTCTYSGAIRVGGILGAWDHKNAATIQYCTNNGTISTYTTTTSSTDLNATAGTYSGIGGVVGTTANYDAANKKTISDCVNTGNITIYSAGAFYLGGVAGCARGSISNCSNTGTITYGKGSTTKRGKCMIGGVVGYGWNLGASGLYFNGTLDAHEADYSKETGVAGLVGEQNANSTFNLCKIGGTIWGGPNVGSTGAGLFICPNSSTKRSSTYTSCIIKTGTVIKYDSNTQTTINSTSDLTATNLHGRMGSSSSSTEGISVGSID